MLVRSFPITHYIVKKGVVNKCHIKSYLLIIDPVINAFALIKVSNVNKVVVGQKASIKGLIQHLFLNMKCIFISNPYGG